MSLEDDWDGVTTLTTFNYGIAAGGKRFVVVGEDGKLAYSFSPDGPWTERTVGTGTRFSVAYGDSTWVAVGGAPIVATDPTGTWTSATTPPNALYSVAYGNGLWVAVGSNVLSFNATDPAGTWTTSGEPVAAYNSVAYGGGKWVAVGGGGRIRYSTDPTDSWLTPSSTGVTSSTTWQSVAYGDGRWLAVGFTSSAEVAHSASDPSGTWSAVTIPLVSGDSFTFGGGVRYLDGTWVVVGSSGYLYYASSPDGPWSTANLTSTQSTGSYGTVAFNGTEWAALGGTRIYYPEIGGPGWGMIL